MERVIQDIEWINHIDGLYWINLRDKNNEKYYFYPELQVEIESENISLYYRVSNRKTQIIFGDSYGRRAYLTDVDIINIIVDSSKEVYETICDILIQFISQPVYEDINFKLDGKDFYYKSILKKDYDETALTILKTKTFETSADIHIKYIDLVTLISLIINKEYLVDIERGTERVLRQAKKFYILSRFYKEGLYEQDLKFAEYDVKLPIEEVYNNNKVAKEIDVIFNDITL